MKRKKVHSVKGTGGNELGDNEKESKNEVWNFIYLMRIWNLKCEKEMK